jgi:hypothetical protein
MPLFLRFSVAVLLSAAAMFASEHAFAQSGESKSGDKPPVAQPGDAAKEAQRQIDEFTEATRLVNGPAGNPECVWLGRRVVGLLWRDDMDTAFRHLDLYDRFGCPGPHIQSAFRCVVRQGNIDPKSPQSLNARVHACWLNPSLPTQAAAAATPAAAAPTTAPAAAAAPAAAPAAMPSPTSPSPGSSGTSGKDAR